jgi:hypothetical protein
MEPGLEAHRAAIERNLLPEPSLHGHDDAREAIVSPFKAVWLVQLKDRIEPSRKAKYSELWATLRLPKRSSRSTSLALKTARPFRRAPDQGPEDRSRGSRCGRSRVEGAYHRARPVYPARRARWPP